MFVFCPDPPQRVAAIARACVFLPHFYKEGFTKYVKGCPLALIETFRLAERAVCDVVSRQSELLSIFFPRWSFIHYCSNTCAHTHIHTRRATFYSLYITLSSFNFFYSHLWHNTARVSERRLRVPVPWGARAFTVWTLHVQWFLPDWKPLIKFSIWQLHHTKFIFRLYLCQSFLNLVYLYCWWEQEHSHNTPFHEHLLEVVPSERAQIESNWNSSQALFGLAAEQSTVACWACLDLFRMWEVCFFFKLTILCSFHFLSEVL